MAFFTYLAICLVIAGSTLLLAVSPQDHYEAVLEDGPVENLTAVAYLLAGIALAAAAWRRRGLARLALAVLAAGMVFICGEEISWGQRILDYATPEFLSHNRQAEANWHNLPRAWREPLAPARWVFLHGPWILAAAGVVTRRNAWHGVPLPSLPLALGLLGALYTWSRWPHSGQSLVIIYNFAGWNIPVLALGLYALVGKRIGLVLAVMGMHALCSALSYVDVPHFARREREVSELLFGLFWLGYAGEALLGRGTAGIRLGCLPASSWAWPLAGLGMSALAIGLIAFEHFGARQLRADHGRTVLAEARRLVESAMPVAGTGFEVGLHAGRLAYHKRPCSAADLSAGKFLLHVFPRDPANLPMYRHRSEFVNLDFPFAVYGALVDGACGAVVPLPNYPIAEVRTGQYTREGKLWQVSLR